MTQPNPHRGVCCVCQVVYRPGIEPASHGLCLGCALAAREQMERDWAALQEQARRGERVQMAGVRR